MILPFLRLTQPGRKNIGSLKIFLKKSAAHQRTQKLFLKIIRHAVDRDNTFKVISLISGESIRPDHARGEIFHADLTAGRPPFNGSIHIEELTGLELPPQRGKNVV